ncbi:MAG: hypothetical protein KKA42_09865 [candidate division Zixibacteria bacterium]|nr:hypothetical protein [candidate division Zixibacteria bacterium]
MRCNEARLRLSGSHRDKTDLAADRDLQEHLKSCAACRAEAAAAGLLSRVFAATSEDDSLAISALADMRKRVESQAAQVPVRESRIGRRFRRPVVALGVLAAAAAVALLTIVPFSYNQTVGYEVSFQCVNREIAEDDERLCELLYTLGLTEADFDLHGCDTTCKLNVMYLKSRQEAQLVVAALATINDECLTADVFPVTEKASGSLINQASDKLLQGAT